MLIDIRTLKAMLSPTEENFLRLHGFELFETDAGYELHSDLSIIRGLTQEKLDEVIELLKKQDERSDTADTMTED